MAERKQIDWEKIRIQYSAGVLSVRDIAEEHGITHVYILKKAKKENWPRDLSAKIQARADQLVTKSGVTEKVTNDPVLEREAIESNALAIANIRLSHRKDIQNLLKIFEKLRAMLEAKLDHNDLLVMIGEAMANPERFDRQNEIYHKIIELPGLSDSYKKIVETFEKLVKLQREAFGIKSGEDEQPPQTFGDIMSLIKNRSKGVLPSQIGGESSE